MLLVSQRTIMILLPLLACVVLRALCAQAEVVDDFASCKDFFYKDQVPTGMDQNAKTICQKYENKYHFATLYSKINMIPVYSAYTFDDSTDECSRVQERSNWFIEPQISGMKEKEMSPDSTANSVKIKTQQAINEDYKGTGFDRGHLNPNCFQKGNGRKATFTLTNAVPMDPCFNRVHWYEYEKWLKDYFSELKTTTKKFLVTGTVATSTYKIPDDLKRVAVPSHVWTAVCYPDSDVTKAFSLGFIGENKPGGAIKVMDVTQLNVELGKLYGSTVKIFADDCILSSNSLTNTVIEKLVKDVQNPMTDRFEKLNGQKRSEEAMSERPAKIRKVNI